MTGLHTIAENHNIANPVPTDPVTISADVPATSDDGGTAIVSKGYKNLWLDVSAVPASCAVDVYLLDENDQRIGAAWQNITSVGVQELSLAWPKIEIVLDNQSAGQETITVVYAMV